MGADEPQLLVSVEFEVHGNVQGDVLPAFGGKLRLFSMRFCPYAHRTTLVLNAKRLEYDTVFINLDSKPEWYPTINPLGSVPALELEPGVVVFDSNIINVYLDEKYPDVPLQSADPLRRAHDKTFVELFAPLTRAYYVAAFNSPSVTADTVAEFFKVLDLVQKELTKRGKKFLHDDEPGLLDYTLWPWLERIEALPILGQKDFALDKSKYDVLTSYIEGMKSAPAVKAYILAPDTHAKYIESRARGAADYNMLDTSGDACCMRPRKKKQ